MTPTHLNEYRDLLAFGLSAVEPLGVELWNIAVSGGNRLSLHLAGCDPEEARRVAFALGVDESDYVQHYSDKTYYLASRGPAPVYYNAPEPYPYAGPSVPFGDRLVEIQVACGLPATTNTATDDGAS